MDITLSGYFKEGVYEVVYTSECSRMRIVKVGDAYYPQGVQVLSAGPGGKALAHYQNIFLGYNDRNQSKYKNLKTLKGAVRYCNTVLGSTM